jgi:hypothetical protein
VTNQSIIFRSAGCFILFVTTIHLFAQQDGARSCHSKAKNERKIPVTWKTFVRAETDRTFSNYSKLGAFGKFGHFRSVTPIDKQDVV